MSDDTNPQDEIPLSAVEEELQEAKKLLAEAEEKLNEMTEMAKRAAADLQNYKRRTDEERADLKVYANLHLLQNIFPALDNFQRALPQMPEELQDNEWVKGILAIEQQLMGGLMSLGLEEIPCETGTKFDPNLHEALMQDNGEKDTVLDCFEKGYTWNGMVVRPAKVKVGNGA